MNEQFGINNVNIVSDYEIEYYYVEDKNVNILHV